MSNNNSLEFLSTRRSGARSIDLRRITEGSTDMACPLTEDEITGHEFGFFVVPKRIHKPPAVGYVACKNIDRGVLPVNSDGTEQWIASVGGLFLLPAYRHGGLATRLVRTISAEIFAIEPEVNAYVAQCNELSAPVFRRAGYESGENTGDGKTPYQITRQQLGSF